MGGMEQRTRERLLRARIAERSCPHCGAAYAPTLLATLAKRRAAWLVLATCPACQRQRVFLVSFPDARPHDEPHETPPDERAAYYAYPQQPDATLLPALPDATEPSLPTVTHLPITGDDVHAIRDFLSGFDGDFRRLFGAQ